MERDEMPPLFIPVQWHGPARSHQSFSLGGLQAVTCDINLSQTTSKLEDPDPLLSIDKKTAYSTCPRLIIGHL